MTERVICEAAPDFRHVPEGDHHGDCAVCVWCRENVVWVSGRWQTETHTA